MNKKIVVNNKDMYLIVWQMKRQKQNKTLYLQKKRKMSAVPLDVAPERRTKRCSPRFRPGGRFWSQVSDTCRQALRERNVGHDIRPCVTDPFHLLHSICSNYSFLFIYQLYQLFLPCHSSSKESFQMSR